MLEPFLTLQEAGFSQKRGQGSPDRHYWSPEMIASLDWLRVAEIARSIAALAGCELAGSQVGLDGSVLFAMLEQPRSPSPQKALVKVSPWNQWRATPEHVEAFADELHTARNARGILIAPGGFTVAALQRAAERRIETVDANSLCQVLTEMPAERSDFYFVVATAGEYATPSCPVCQRKMTRQTRAAPMPPLARLFDESGLVAEEVFCHLMEVKPDCEITFLHEARCRKLIVHGHAAGDFVCEGPVTLEPSATLDGTVAARSLDVKDGAELRGKFRILEGAPQSFVTPKLRWEWRCPYVTENPTCATVAFEPHELEEVAA
jgi:hypothetical protein